MQKTMDYTQKFSKFSHMQTVKKVRTKLSVVFTEFEMAQIANLGLDQVEEALVLVPSLKNKEGLSEDTLQNVLNDMQDLKKFQAWDSGNILNEADLIWMYYNLSLGK